MFAATNRKMDKKREFIEVPFGNFKI